MLRHDSPFQPATVFNVKSYGAAGDGATDDATAITAAMTAATASGGIVWLPSSAAAFCIKSTITVPASVQFAGPGTLKALATFTGSMMVLMSTNSQISIATMDGTGLTAPVGAWTGAGVGTARSPAGCGIFINGASGSTIPNCVIAVDTFQNFPSGPICAFYADGLLVSSRRYLTVQTYTGGETNGVVTAFNTVNARFTGGLINGYSWKGYYFGNCTDCIGIGCNAMNGLVGHSSHYDTGGTRCGFIDCAQDGSGTGGDGYKAYLSSNPFIRGFSSKSSTGAAVLFDSCTDYEFSGIHALDPANGGIYLSADTSALLRGKGSDWFVKRTVQGTTANHVAIKIVSNATYQINDIYIGPGVASNGLYGISSGAIASATVANVVIDAGVYYELSSQYDIFGYFKSVSILGGQIVRTASSGSGADVFLSTNTGVAGGTLFIGKLRVTGFGTTDIITEIAGTWDTVIVDGLATELGGKPLKIDAGSSVKNVVINSLTGYAAGQATAVDLNFNQALTTRLTVKDLQLPTAAGSYQALVATVSGSAVVVGYGVQTLTDAATIAIDPANGTDYEVTLGGNRTVGAPSTPVTGQRINLVVIQDVTGGRTLAWNAVFKQGWSDIGNVANARASISFVYDGTNWNQIGAQNAYGGTVVATTAVDGTFRIVGSGDATKKFGVEVDSLTTGKTLTLDTGAQTVDRTITVPVLNVAANLVMREAALVDNAVVRADSTLGLIQNSGVIIDDSNNVTGVVGLTATAKITWGASGSYTNGCLYNSATLGTVLALQTGSTYDWYLGTPTGGSDILTVPTGTQKLVMGSTVDASAIGTAAWVNPGGQSIAKRSYLGTIGGTFKGNVDAGVQDATAAVAGQVGEVISASVTGYTNYTTTGTIQQLTTITLTAGDWMMYATVTYYGNSATNAADGEFVSYLCDTTASATGAVEGETLVYQDQPVTGTLHRTVTISFHEVTNASKSKYLNGKAAFTLGNPQYTCSLKAVRIR